jgi:hypothetical protein
VTSATDVAGNENAEPGSLPAAVAETEEHGSRIVVVSANGLAPASPLAPHRWHPAFD